VRFVFGETSSSSSLLHFVLLVCLGENYKTDGYVITPKTMQLLEEHLKAINGRVVCLSCFL